MVRVVQGPDYRKMTICLKDAAVCGDRETHIETTNLPINESVNESHPLAQSHIPVTNLPIHSQSLTAHTQTKSFTHQFNRFITNSLTLSYSCSLNTFSSIAIYFVKGIHIV